MRHVPKREEVTKNSSPRTETREGQEGLAVQAQLLGAAAVRVQPPEIDRELPSHGHDSFFARGSGAKRRAGLSVA